MASLRSGESATAESSATGPSETLQPPEDSQCSVQILYAGPSKCHCCTNWVEEYPDDLGKAVESKPETKRKALVRMRKSHGDDSERKLLTVDSIVVQSRNLKTTLGEVFEGYEGITTSLERLVFKSPFHSFYYRWGRFSKILERQRREDPEYAAFSQLMHDTVDAELRGVRKEVEDLLHHGIITYPLLWALFEPGTRVFAMQDGLERFATVFSQTKEYWGFGVGTKFLTSNGFQFGSAKKDFYTQEFASTQKITDLTCYPASCLPSREETEKRAISRGRRFCDLAGCHYMAHSGRLMLIVCSRRAVLNHDGRIVIDATQGNWGALASLDSDATLPSVCVRENMHREAWDDFSEPDSWDLHHQESVLPVGKKEIKDGAPERGTGAVEGPTDAQLMLCDTHVYGYSLTLKDWYEFEVDDVYEINWNDAAYPNLMLPSGYKNLAESFVSGQTRDKRAFDDIIEGKGLGLVMLLAGSPGTGKTLTAEAIVDKARRPLYTLSAGELGKDSREVEERLRAVFALAERWNAIILFDECDVFLQERHASQLAHNEIVAVFLRMIEYYRGILIMTSNRAEAIDRAFRSRIHLTLLYPDLNPDAREQIWRRLISHSDRGNDLTDETYRKLAQLSLNGRLIKNAIKIAVLLATHQETTLGLQQIYTVVKATMGLDIEGM